MLSAKPSQGKLGQAVLSAFSAKGIKHKLCFLLNPERVIKDKLCSPLNQPREARTRDAFLLNPAKVSKQGHLVLSVDH